MLAPMNHREIEYQANQFWLANGTDLKQIPQLFSKLSEMQNDLDGSQIAWSAQNLMQWLEETGEAVFIEDLLLDYGKDCLRCYLLFEKTPKAEDYDLDTWEECSLEGVYKFLRRYRQLILTVIEANQQGCYAKQDMAQQLQYLNQIKYACLDALQKQDAMFKHHIMSALMEGLKDMQKSLHVKGCQGERNPKVDKLCQELIILLAPFAPHLCEVLWRKTADTSVLEQVWTVDEPRKLSERISLPIQVNAKTKKVIQVEKGLDSKEAEQRAREALSTLLLDSQKQYRVIYVPDRIINFIEQ